MLKWQWHSFFQETISKGISQSISKYNLENSFENCIFIDVSFSIPLLDDLHKKQSEDFSLSCELTNSIFLLAQDFIVTWSKVERETSSILAYFLSSSQNTTIYEPRVSWNKERINQSDFFLTLKDLRVSDSGEYLCNISSSKYTLLTTQTLHVVGKLQVGLDNWFWL